MLRINFTPHTICIKDFLGTEICDQLLKFAIASEGAFHPTTVGGMSATNPNVRRSVCIDSMGSFHELVEERVRRVVRKLTHDLRLSRFEPGIIDLQLVAHGDGGFYKRHIDTFTGTTRFINGDRAISCVYYFFNEPKSFSGGEIRFHPLPTKTKPAPESFEVPIINDTLVAFSSWIPHEVLAVSTPSGAFTDSRFSVNCWVHRPPRVVP